jgi:hypothetical protein
MNGSPAQETATTIPHSRPSDQRLRREGATVGSCRDPCRSSGAGKVHASAGRGGARLIPRAPRNSVAPWRTGMSPARPPPIADARIGGPERGEGKPLTKSPSGYSLAL